LFEFYYSLLFLIFLGPRWCVLEQFNGLDV